MLRNRADSVAMRAVRATGGRTAWEGVRFLRFDFAAERNGERGRSVRHLWDRRTGDYRVEWRVGDDSTAIALFNVNTREGDVYVAGQPAEGDVEKRLLETAYQRYINDTYWLLAPAKLFDAGVLREYDADSSSATEDALHLSFRDVGLTPGDQYWLHVDHETGDVMGWTYVLQGPAHRRGSYRWMPYRPIDGPAGQIRLSERKETLDGSRAILTDHIRLPAQVAADLFANPRATME